MQGDWLIWVIGVLVLVVAGFGAAYLSRRRVRHLYVGSAWATARSAIESAGVSRDAARGDHPEADALLARAELIAADHGGARAADEVAELAERADLLWRGGTDGS